jgi:hypothetical protein
VAQWLVWEVVGGTPRCPTAICIAAAAARFVCTDLSVGRQYHVCDGAVRFCSVLRSLYPHVYLTMQAI